MINVHLVPHSHDDVGWLKTVDQYYYGSKNKIQHAGVQYILDSVMAELLKDPQRRFIQVETAFFAQWYNEQTASVQKTVKKLVNEGRLEFIGGGWSMNDEATIHYQSTIDHFSVGLKFLSDNFGTCGRPRVGWQIDPFGHSREMASIFAQMGYDGEFFARVDYNEKNERLRNLTAEMVWSSSISLGAESDIFTGILYNHYSAPPGFCFDLLCTDEPIIDGDTIANNVQERVATFVNYTMNMAQYYRTSHLMMPMGDDFNYENANLNYKNMDKLIKYVNALQSQGSNINVFYSTPSCYLKALHEAKISWPNKRQDFFPYSTDWHTYWTGYYTSRPTHKRLERDGNHILQVAKQMSSLAKLNYEPYTSNLDQLRHAMGVMQHHDAITGTEKQVVAYDYERMMSEAIASASINTNTALKQLTKLDFSDFVSCLQLNISVCNYTTKAADGFVVTLFNPLGWPSTQYVRVPVKDMANYRVTNSKQEVLNYQLVPIAKEVLSLPFRKSEANYELVFRATVNKLSNFFIRRNVPIEPAQIDLQPLPEPQESIEPRTPIQLDKRYRYEVIQERGLIKRETIVENKFLRLVFGKNGLLKQIKKAGRTTPITQQFYYYRAAMGNNEEFKNRSSGAYIFRPNGTEQLVAKEATLTVYRGNLVTEVHQKFNDWVSQVVRLYEDRSYVEFEWLIGSIPITDGVGKEIITRFTTPINNKGVFLTDSNGRELVVRSRNRREYFTPNMTEQVSGNYYPVTARIAISDIDQRMTLFTDRAHGGSSLTDGSVELMLHRRLLNDDAFGVGEALNETSFGRGLVARGKYYLMLGDTSAPSTQKERRIQQQLHLPFSVFFSRLPAANQTISTSIDLDDFPILPYNVQLLTLEPYSKNEHLLRLENFMDSRESTSATFNIRDLFDYLKGEEIRETALDGNMPLSDLKRFKFGFDGTVPNGLEYYTPSYKPLSLKKKDSASKFSITLRPMQIRTFIIKVK